MHAVQHARDGQRQPNKCDQQSDNHFVFTSSLICEVFVTSPGRNVGVRVNPARLVFFGLDVARNDGHEPVAQLLLFGEFGDKFFAAGCAGVGQHGSGVFGGDPGVVQLGSAERQT
ncbi:hypothetical protein [Mycobacterium paraense]|uniref:hypothetical protein n=1 Tax=Mycobacterium paraense TaxID=767916 RepID=UPI00111C8C28|nr:hypothetical protein [Mycobacterium paraense]